MTFSRAKEPFLSDKQINAFVDGVHTPHSVTVKKTRILPGIDKKFSLEPGYFICKIAGEFHFLPRAAIKVPFEGLKGTIHPWQMFKVGDLLSVVEPHISLTATALPPDSSVVITVSGSADTFKFTGAANTPPSDIALLLSDFVNQSPVLSQLIVARSQAEEITLFSADGNQVHTVSTVPAFTTTPSDGKMLVLAPFGEISSISSDNPGEITLSAPPNIKLPAGSHIGIPVNDILGYCHHSTDWTNKESMILAPIAAAHGTYEGALPYVDGDIKRRLDLRIRKKF